MDLEKLSREVAGTLTTCPIVADVSTPGMGTEFAPIIIEALRSVAAQARREGIEEAAKLMVDLGESGDAERIRALATEDKEAWAVGSDRG